MNYRHLTLLAAERELVGACLDHVEALETACRLLPTDPYRSSEAYHLGRIFYALLGMRERGAYDPLTNRDQLASLFPDPRESAGYLDGLWSGHGLFPWYVEGLCKAISDHHALLERAASAVKSWHYANPLSIETESASPPPTPRRSPRVKQRPRWGGVG